MSLHPTGDYFENVRLSREFFRRALSNDVDLGPLDSVDRQTLVTGSGSSYSMALLLSDLLRRHGCRARAIYPYDLTRHERLDDELVVGISQSGETTDICNAVDRARDSGCQTIGITAVDASSLGNSTDHSLLFEPAGEHLLSRSCGVMSCLGLLLELYGALGNPAPEGWPSHAVDRVATVTEEQLESNDRGREAAEYVFLAGGTLRAVATESALTLQESTLRSASRYDVKDFAHGTAIRYASAEDTVFVLLEAQDDDSAVFDAVESTLVDLGYDPIRVTSAFDQPWAAADSLAWALAFSARLNERLGINLANPPGIQTVWPLLTHQTTPGN